MVEESRNPSYRFFGLTVHSVMKVGDWCFVGVRALQRLVPGAIVPYTCVHRGLDGSNVRSGTLITILGRLDAMHGIMIIVGRTVFTN